MQIEKNKLGFGILEAILSEENLDFAYLVVIQEKDPIEFWRSLDFKESVQLIGINDAPCAFSSKARRRREERSCE